MRRSFVCLLSLVATAVLHAPMCLAQAAALAPANFTRLQQLPAPKLVASAESYPGEYAAGNLVDGQTGTEYASNGKGTNTFVEFEFKEPTRLAGFRYVDR